MTLQFGARNAKFSNNDQFRLMTISFCCILGEAWGVVGWILDIKGGKEIIYIISLSEVQ